VILIYFGIGARARSESGTGDSELEPETSSPGAPARSWRVCASQRRYQKLRGISQKLPSRFGPLLLNLFQALRILTLLEEHHRRLAKIIRSSAVPALPNAPSDESEKSEGAAPDPSAPVPKGDKSTEKTKSASPARIRRPHRDLSSSIANNLATARGKPSAQRRTLPSLPQVTAQHAEGRSFPRTNEANATIEGSRNTPSAKEKKSETQPKDESFNRFFSTFEGLFSKLSAPLAFAGLPLTAQEQQEAEKTAQKSDKNRVPASDEPSLDKIYSKAALRVLREDGGAGFGVQDSFYWVQPTGGTATYANIITGRGGHDAHVPETIEEDAEEFVDARETPGPPSPRSIRSSLREKARKDIKSAGGKTMEELELENTALRQILDTQSRRLQMWEASAQAQSLAFSQSLRSARGPAAAETADEDARVRELEELLRTERAERDRLEHRNEKMERENEKLLGVIGRYREKWEVLKEGARRRDKSKTAPSVASTDSSNTRVGPSSQK